MGCHILRRLIWVYTVCSGLSVRIHMVNTIGLRCVLSSKRKIPLVSKSISCMMLCPWMHLRIICRPPLLILLRLLFKDFNVTESCSLCQILQGKMSDQAMSASSNVECMYCRSEQFHCEQILLWNINTLNSVLYICRYTEIVYLIHRNKVFE